MISILLPTCFRPNHLREMLRTLRTTTQGYELEIISVVDEDNESKDILTFYDADVIDFSPVKRGALWSWNRALQLSDGDIIVPAGDDQVFHEYWLDYALESHNTKLKGYGVVGMNDLAYNGDTQVATMFLFDRKYCKEQMGGVFAPPMYHYYCIDSEWNEKAKVLGKFFWDERSIVEHLHSAHGKRSIDLHDQYKMDRNWMLIDNVIFESRKKSGFPVIWESII